MSEVPLYCQQRRHACDPVAVAGEGAGYLYLERARECVRVCVCFRERVCVRERVCERECVCVRERECVRESVCV